MGLAAPCRRRSSGRGGGFICLPMPCCGLGPLCWTMRCQGQGHSRSSSMQRSVGWSAKLGWQGRQGHICRGWNIRGRQGRRVWQRLHGIWQRGHRRGTHGRGFKNHAHHTVLPLHGGCVWCRQHQHGSQNRMGTQRQQQSHTPQTPGLLPCGQAQRLP